MVQRAYESSSIDWHSARAEPVEGGAGCAMYLWDTILVLVCIDCC